MCQTRRSAQTVAHIPGNENSDALITSSSWNLSPHQDTKSFSWTGVSHDNQLNTNLTPPDKSPPNTHPDH